MRNSLEKNIKLKREKWKKEIKRKGDRVGTWECHSGKQTKTKKKNPKRPKGEKSEIPEIEKIKF